MIIKKWSELLDRYTCVHLTKTRDLVLSLVIFTLMVIGAIFVLNMPERVAV